MFIDNLKLSFKIIFRNKFRSLFMIFGIVGVSFVLSLYFAFGKNIEIKFSNNVRKMGCDFVKVKTSNYFSGFKYFFNFDDINSLKNSSLGIKSISPEIFLKGKIDNKLSSLNSYIICGNEDYFEFMTMDLISGRFFNKHECVNKEKVVLIDVFTSLKLFGTENSIGKYVDLEDGKSISKFRIIGILSYPSRVFKEINSVPSFCIIPINTYAYSLGGNKNFEYMYVSPQKNENIYSLSREILKFLKIKKGALKDEYEIESFINQENRFRGLENIFYENFKFTFILMVFLCGLNIMCVMLYNVNNRIFEICLRRSLGGSRIHVFGEFIFESFILSFLGGLIGIFVFVIFNFMFSLNYSFGFLNFIFSLLCISLIGILFGIFPALKASNIMNKYYPNMNKKIY